MSIEFGDKTCTTPEERRTSNRKMTTRETHVVMLSEEEKPLRSAQRPIAYILTLHRSENVLQAGTGEARTAHDFDNFGI
jgi:hypothetical protein